MGGLIEGAKRKIWSIATVIADANPDADIRMGLVAYRDIGEEYVTKTFDLTTDIQDLYANLLELKARGGGDWPVSVNEALEVAVNKLRWTPAGDVRRIVFLVGDAPPHMAVGAGRSRGAGAGSRDSELSQQARKSVVGSRHRRGRPGQRRRRRRYQLLCHRR
jgi:hypothetical protein